MNLPSKNTIASSIFALIGAVILGGTIYAYSYLGKRDKNAEGLVRTASNLVSNKKQLAIEEIRANLAQARSALQTETDRLESMKTIVENDGQLRESVAGARIQAKMDAKRAALEDTLRQWRDELKSTASTDNTARERLRAKYQEIIDAHFAEIRDIIDSADSGLTDEEKELANDSMDETEDAIDDYADDLSEPPADDGQSDDGVNGDGNADDGNGDLAGDDGGVVDDDGDLLPPPLVIDDDDVDDQGDIVDDIGDEVGDLEDDLDDALNDDAGDNDGDGDNTDDGILPPDDSNGDLPPLPPPQPRELNPDKPKLLQGSDL